MKELFVNLMDLLSNADTYLEVLLTGLGMWGVVVSCMLITVESIIPVLPLCVFIYLVNHQFGLLIGTIICWIFTCVGCFLSFGLCRKGFKGFMDRFLNKADETSKVKALMKRIDKMSLSSLAVLVAIPFTPAFAVNIAAGMSNIRFKKFAIAMFIGKIYMVFFWGFIGQKLIECIKAPINFLWIFLMVVCAYIFSKVANKYLMVD